MVKKCSVEYDELGKPIGLVDLKEFTDTKSFKDFEQLCKKNREEFLKRKAAADDKNAYEKQFVFDELARLSETLKDAMFGIAYLLGVGDFKDIESVFESYVKGEPKHEEEN